MTAQNQQSPNGASRPAESRRLARIGSALRHKLWLTLAGLALGGLLAALYLHFAPMVYEATAVLKVGTDELLALDIPEDLRPAAAGTASARQIRETLLSAPFLARVVETNALARDTRFSPQPEDGASGTASLATRLADCLTVTIAEKEALVNVRVSHHDRELTAQLANSLVDELVRQSAWSRDELFKQVTNALVQKISSAQRSLASAREEELRLKTRQDELALELRDLKSGLLDARARRIPLETDERALQQHGTNIEALLELASIAGDAKVKELRAALVQKEQAFDRVKLEYKWKHPTYLAADREVTSGRQSLRDAVRAAADGRRASLATAKAAEADLQQRVEERTAEAAKLTQRLAENSTSIAAKDRELQPLFVRMQKLQDATMNREVFGSPLRVADKAGVPLHPKRPDRFKVLCLGLLGGLLVGLFVSLAVGMVDTSLKSVEETEQLLGLTVLSAVPPVPPKQPKPGPLGPTDQAHFAVAEAFRSLRTSVSVIAKEKELKSFLFTSATPKEGKTLCALGYAVSLAQQGLRTLLIECDLRRPMAAVALAGIKQDSRGVSDYLKAQPTPSTFQPAEPKPRNEGGLSFAELRRKQHAVAEAAAASPAPNRRAERPEISSVTLDDIVQKTEIDGLSFISAGTPVPNPAELLARQGLSKLLGEALRRFDRIVIDAAPLMGISDTLLLVNQVQATCLVVRAHQTQRRAVIRAVEMLRRADAPLLGAILNDFSAAKSERYGDYYQYYGRVTKPGEPKAP